MLISLFLLFSFPRRLNFLVSDTFLLYTLPFGLMTILLWEISIWLCCAFLLTSFEIKTNIKSVREDEALFHHMKKRLMLMVVCILYLYVYVRLCIDFFYVFDQYKYCLHFVWFCVYVRKEPRAIGHSLLGLLQHTQSLYTYNLFKFESTTCKNLSFWSEYLI